jgi:AcrR family transcriptional regulator
VVAPCWVRIVPAATAHIVGTEIGKSHGVPGLPERLVPVDKVDPTALGPGEDMTVRAGPRVPVEVPGKLVHQARRERGPLAGVIAGSRSHGAVPRVLLLDLGADAGVGDVDVAAPVEPELAPADAGAEGDEQDEGPVAGVDGVGQLEDGPGVDERPFGVAFEAVAPAGVGVGRGAGHVRVALWRAWRHGRHASRLRDTLSIVKLKCIDIAAMYTWVMPKLWNETIEAHRRAVRDATLDTTAALVAEHGLRSVTMSQIAETTGIGRATLYKYFADVEAILVAWHERQVTGHLEYLAQVRDQAGDASQRLEAVLEAYALISHEHHDNELVAQLHRGEHVARAEQHLSDLIRDLLIEGAETGDVRDDVPPGELASYCLHALTAASNLPSKAAARRLVTVTLAGLAKP